MTLSKYNFKLYSEMVMLPQIPQIWGGSGALKHGLGFLGKPDPIFLEMVALFWVKMGNLFWGQNGGTPGYPRSSKFGMDLGP